MLILRVLFDVFRPLKLISSELLLCILFLALLQYHPFFLVVLPIPTSVKSSHTRCLLSATKKENITNFFLQPRRAKLN